MNRVNKQREKRERDEGRGNTEWGKKKRETDMGRTDVGKALQAVGRQQPKESRGWVENGVGPGAPQTQAAVRVL